ncbi:uncharacterized protein LOC121732456 [Aricia agestis]|uniref:uncharacterized protein LOC121732456 n=1 Tax=Aricia agestis TaxID=91739 RepID=UPI001C20ACFA|nr:uncharacterized protein LOC121732456 [Aricia agestis]
MGYVLLQYAYLIVFMTFYVGQGDGRLKRTAKDTLKHDLKLYKKMIGKINRELDTFYDEYPDDPMIEYYQDDIFYIKYYEKEHKHPKIDENNIDDAIIRKHKKIKHHQSLPLKTQNEKERGLNETNLFHIKDERYTWPKFDDILLAMGKKYDWKNDRWIKVKSNIEDKTEANTSHKEFNEKHHFKYRIVKLNRTKSKRNIVIAVTAVR